MSLSQIVKNVSEHLGVEVKFAPDCANASAEASALKPGEALLLENLRFYPEEEGKPVGIDKEDPAYDAAKKEMKERQKEFAKKLASYADCYVMDAFGTAHRKHASTAVIDEYFDGDHKMLGYLMEKKLTPLTMFSATSSVRSLPSWVVLRYLQRLVSSRTCSEKLTT